MAHKTVETAVEARLRANWSACAIMVENGQETPPDGNAAYLTLQFPIAQARRWSTGTRLYREEGAFRLVLSIPAGTGVETLRDWGDDLGTLFRDVSFAGVVCQVPSPPFFDDRGEGSFAVAAIVCPYTFNFTEEA